MYSNSEDSPLMYNLLSGCSRLEKLTYKKDVIRFSQIKFPDAGQVLNSSLITLNLSTTDLKPEILSAYSHVLPELHNLAIENDCEISDPTLFVIDMYWTKFGHLQVDLFIALYFPIRFEETFDQPVLLEVMTQKSGAKHFLASFVSSNQIEESTGDKKYAWKFVINCASIDFISIKINKTRILKNYPLFL